MVMSMNITNAQNGRYAEVNGLHMYYEEYGKGSPLVLIHADEFWPVDSGTLENTPHHWN